MHTLQTARNLYKQQGRVTIAAPASVARIARCYPADVVPAAQPSPDSRSGNVRTELEAVVLRSAAANGFGDAEVGQAQPFGALDSVQLYQLARAHRSYRLAEIFAVTVQAATDAVRRMLASWKRQRQARATYLALRTLNERTLRDLGFDRSELLSVATEAAGSGDFTRVRLMQEARV